VGHAVLCAQPFVGAQPFVVALGDSIIGVNAQSDIVKRMIECFWEHNAEAVVAFEQVARAEVYHYGIAQPKTRGDVFEIADVIEKPSVAEAPSTLAIAARYVFAPTIFEALQRTTPGKNGEIQLTDAIRLLLQDGRKVYGMTLRNERRYDIGNFDSYFRAFVEFALADAKHGADLREYVKELMNDHHS
jgi:UTP--glucose-1-phosphate uridylyltransferase